MDKTPSSTQINYFNIGSFVVIGTALLIIGLLLLGSGKLFEKTISLETYFNESVQGLSIGSAVKYQGVEIGHVKKIDFVNDVYHLRDNRANGTYNRYIYVEMVVTPNFLPQLPGKSEKRIFEHSVKQGLRVKLALQGLTGKAYLELDFANAKENPPLSIAWKPAAYYIPSTKSTLTQVGDSIQQILYALKDVNYQQIFLNIQRVAASTNEVMSKMNLLLNDWQYTSRNLQNFSETVKNAPAQIFFGKAPSPLDPSQL